MRPRLAGRSRPPRPSVILGGPGWDGAKLGLTGLKSRPPWERFCCAHADAVLTFPPLVKGGSGGVGHITSASSVYSPFAIKTSGKDTRYRREAAHVPSTSSINRAQAHRPRALDAHRPTPPSPPSQGGEKKRERSLSVRNLRSGRRQSQETLPQRAHAAAELGKLCPSRSQTVWHNPRAYSHPLATSSSLPEIDKSARRTAAVVLAFKNLTEPSTNAAFTPPTW